MSTVHLIPPIVIILVSIPMILGVVPRNGAYGFRTPKTRSSDAVWYPANRVSGIAITVAGLAWLVAALMLPGFTDTNEQAVRYILVIGLGSLGLAVLVSFLYLRRL